MTNAHHRDGDYTPATGRRSRNLRLGVGAAGLAAVLGAGAYVLTDHLTERPEAQVAAPAAGGAEPSVTGPTMSAEPGVTTSPTTTPRPSATTRKPNEVVLAMPSSVQSRLDDARSANEKMGTGAKHPAPLTVTDVDPTRVKVVQTGSPAKGHTMKVSSAPLDLTGYHELAWVRGGERHGGATCTQTITVSPDVPPATKPTLLICWQTSAEKSVYTVTVDFKGHPSVTKSVAALRRAWAAMK